MKIGTAAMDKIDKLSDKLDFGLLLSALWIDIFP